MLYEKRKHQRIGSCRICCAKSVQLTWDHIPPKGAVELTEVEITAIFNALNPEASKQRPEFSQNGLKLRKICGECNSLLGNKYAPALIDFSLAVARLLKSQLIFPDVLHIRSQPNLIARSILGHLMAANLTGEDEGFDSAIRPAVLGEYCPIPESISIFYWLHPFDNQITLPGFFMPAKDGEVAKIGVFGVLKYFPVGFLLTDQAEYDELEELSRWRGEPSERDIDLPVRLSKQSRDPFWPERPREGSYSILL
jgi:hypothetical protein